MKAPVETRLTAEQLRAKFEEILSPAVDCKAPYAKVMISLLVKEAETRAEAAEAEVAALRERCETFVEHTCTGSALCKECRKALSAAPERPTTSSTDVG